MLCGFSSTTTSSAWPHRVKKRGQDWSRPQCRDRHWYLGSRLWRRTSSI
ncbi:hypothetical protein CGRA01v4_05412 [Colletotrichum graminicola]|nr:hypothetical protein CGRA01v4_05412 [Colletotrichum graminicola]